MNISFEKPYYIFTKCENIESKDAYNKFLNWVQGEFDLYQMDEFEGVTVYYPNGWFTIKMVNKKNNIFYTEIYVKCKSKKVGLEICDKIELLYNHLIKCLS